MIIDEIAQYTASLVSGVSYSAASGGNTFVGWIAPDPDRAIGVYTVPTAEADSKLPFTDIGFQVIARCEDGSTWADDTLRTLFQQLHGKRNITLTGGTLVLYFLATQGSPFRLGPDKNGRTQVSLNFRAEIHDPTTERP